MKKSYPFSLKAKLMNRNLILLLVCFLASFEISYCQPLINRNIANKDSILVRNDSIFYVDTASGNLVLRCEKKIVKKNKYKVNYYNKRTGKIEVIGQVDSKWNKIGEWQYVCWVDSVYFTVAKGHFKKVKNLEKYFKENNLTRRNISKYTGGQLFTIESKQLEIQELEFGLPHGEWYFYYVGQGLRYECNYSYGFMIEKKLYDNGIMTESFKYENNTHDSYLFGFPVGTLWQPMSCSH